MWLRGGDSADVTEKSSASRLTLGEYDGIPCHHWEDELPLIAAVLAMHRPQVVIELGSMFGGFAAFLADTIRPWSGRVTSFDHELKYAVSHWGNVRAQRSNLSLNVADIFDKLEDVAGMITYSRALIYCDGGEKERELRVYASILKQGDVIGVHDFLTEARPDVCRQIADEFSLAPYHHAPFEAMERQFVSRFWIKI